MDPPYRQPLYTSFLFSELYIKIAGTSPKSPIEGGWLIKEKGDLNPISLPNPSALHQPNAHWIQNSAAQGGGKGLDLQFSSQKCTNLPKVDVLAL